MAPDALDQTILNVVQEYNDDGVRPTYWALCDRVVRIVEIIPSLLPPIWAQGQVRKAIHHRIRLLLQEGLLHTGYGPTAYYIPKP